MVTVIVRVTGTERVVVGVVKPLPGPIFVDGYNRKWHGGGAVGVQMTGYSTFLTCTAYKPTIV